MFSTHGWKVCGWVLAMVRGTSCRWGMRAVEIPIYRKPNTPAVAVVRMELPSTWRALTPSASRVEYLAPDNKTRCYFRTMKGADEKKECTTLTTAYVAEVIGSWGPGTKVVSRGGQAPEIDFELRRTNPQPDGETIWSKVNCKHGVLAIASCATANTSVSELKSRCSDIVSRFEILPAPPVPGA